MRAVIHRDWTFEHNEHRYSVTQGGPGWGYAIYAENGVVVGEGFDSLKQLRDYVEQGWLDHDPAS